jgi:hypothetical protein
LKMNNKVTCLDNFAIGKRENISRLLNWMSTFYWAKFRKNKGVVKMHTLLDLRGNIPVFI